MFRWYHPRTEDTTSRKFLLFFDGARIFVGAAAKHDSLEVVYTVWVVIHKYFMPLAHVVLISIANYNGELFRQPIIGDKRQKFS